jgi:hypothetical protein
MATRFVEVHLCAAAARNAVADHRCFPISGFANFLFNSVTMSSLVSTASTFDPID